MTSAFYVLFVCNDIEPQLHGPFDDPDERDDHARTLRRQHGDDHGIFPLDIDDDGVPSTSAYSHAFFQEVNA